MRHKNTFLRNADKSDRNYFIIVAATHVSFIDRYQTLDVSLNTKDSPKYTLTDLSNPNGGSFHQYAVGKMLKALSQAPFESKRGV